MIHFNNLPELVHLTIFSNLDFSSQLLLGRVCEKWRAYQKSTIAGKIESVTLMLGYDPQYLLFFGMFRPFSIPHYEKVLAADGVTRQFPDEFGPATTHLRYRTLDEDTVALLIESLPSIKNFHIIIHHHFCTTQLTDHILRLLCHWSSTLTTFKMIAQFRGYFYEDKDNIPRNEVGKQMDRILKQLDKMLNLEHLTMHIMPRLFDYYSLQIPPLKQLRQFYFGTDDQCPPASKPYGKWLKCYAVQNSRLEIVGFDNYLPWFPKRNANGGYRKIGHISSSFQLENFQPFISLTSVQLNFSLDKCTFIDLTRILSPLSQLVHLRLNLTLPTEPIPIHIPFITLTPLVSIRILQIQLCNVPTNSLQSTAWAFIFAHIQVLEVIDDLRQMLQMPNCRPRITLDQLQTSIDQLLGQFRSCSHLRHIYVTDERFLSKTYTFDKLST